ncbi:MAG TPA: acyl-CoA dehydrogenase family protein, partial [Kofleriaceae bacterium]|nr:acyl-CoA dehydrogenase family protein [Kofleriaceae bacterium]
MNDKTTFERAAQGPMRLLTRIGGGDFLDKLGIRVATERVLHGVGAAAGKAMARPAKSRRNGANGTPAKASTAPAKLAVVGEAARLAPVMPTGSFDLRPTEDQEMIVATARRFADEVMRRAAHAADAQAAPDPAVLAAAQELGLAALVIPEAAGGIAESRASVTTVLAIEELARGDMGLALAMLAPLGVVNALVEYGTYAQQQAWLPRFAGDAFVPAALALLESRPGSDPVRPQTGAVRAPGGWKLYGEKVLVPLGETAELFIVLAEIKGAGPRLFLVPKGTAGVMITRQPAMGLRAGGLCRLAFDGAFVPADALLGG